MAIKGERFELDLDADNFTFNPTLEDDDQDLPEALNAVGEIQERTTSGVPSAPKANSTKTGFPEHRPKRKISSFKQQQQYNSSISSRSPNKQEPSDKAILHHVGQKHGLDLASQERAAISTENKQKLESMSTEDIEEARAGLMSSLNPALIERLLRRANIDDQTQHENEWQKENELQPSPQPAVKRVAFEEHEDTTQASATNPEPKTKTSVHFPSPPRDPSLYVPLDPDAPDFLSDLKKHYFPDTPHDPSTLAWLQDPTAEEDKSSPYNPAATAYNASAIRFDFKGRIIPPSESIDIPVDQGLHHHGEAPSSAGYTIPELAILCRSTMPNQRCIAYQVLGRILFRLGRGDFGPRGSELQEGLWDVIESERPVEVMMAEANKYNGHVSAKSYATEALWLWRRGGGGDRGVLGASERRAK